MSLLTDLKAVSIDRRILPYVSPCFLYQSKCFSYFLASSLDSARFIFSFILCLLSTIDGEDNDDNAVLRGAGAVVEDMPEVSLIINVYFSLLFCNFVQL